jgi:antitoxin Phd
MSTNIAPVSWRLQDAKAQFSAVVEYALRGQVQRVTRRGKPAVVIMAEQDYVAMQRNASAQAPGFVAHLLAMPKPTVAKPRGTTKGSTKTILALRDIDFS